MKSRKAVSRCLCLVMVPALLVFATVAPAGDDFSEIAAFRQVTAYRQIMVINDVMRLPSDVAVDQQGRIYILDGTASLVRVYDRQGRPAFTLGGGGVLKQPLGLDVSAGGDVLVADSGNRRLVFFPADSSPPRFIKIPALPGDKPPDPTDAAFGSREGTFHVVDNDNHRLVTLDQDGTISWFTGSMGRNREEFRFPFMLDLDTDGNIYIVEVINTRVQVLDQDGAHVRFIGDWGIEPGQFFRPKGIAVNERNEVFVSDSYLGVVQIFSREGQLVGIVGDEHGNLTKFTTPVGLTTAGNRLFLVEMWNNRLLVLEEVSP
ncbi:MAG: NHL repeat-containing protein [Desulfobulbaceae bacterium]|nr:NHL repeat-containing protein [Desulfobulbaceae bacterium]